MRQTENQSPTKQKSFVKQTGEATPKKRFSVSTPREYTDADGEVKTYWNFVGSAFESKNGFNIVLDALPINGKLFINLNPEPTRA
jgi:hypothetical protein